MRKIPTVFVRDGRKVIDEVTPGCEWVLAGEGVATEKLDGTNVRLTVRCGQVVRVEARRNPSPAKKGVGIFDPWYRDADGPTDKWITMAVECTDTREWPDGEHCCEAMGPKIQGNPLGLETPVCWPFDLRPPPMLDVPRAFVGMGTCVLKLDSTHAPGRLAEGIVFHHPDGRRAKIKRRDFE